MGPPNLVQRAHRLTVGVHTHVAMVHILEAEANSQLAEFHSLALARKKAASDHRAGRVVGQGRGRAASCSEDLWRSKLLNPLVASASMVWLADPPPDAPASSRVRAAEGPRSSPWGSRLEAAPRVALALATASRCLAEMHRDACYALEGPQGSILRFLAQARALVEAAPMRRAGTCRASAPARPLQPQPMQTPGAAVRVSPRELPAH